jgi:endonuclease G
LLEHVDRYAFLAQIDKPFLFLHNLGRFQTYQRSIRQAEALTRLDFGKLKDLDGFSNEQARTGTRIEVELRTLADVRV